MGNEIKQTEIETASGADAAKIIEHHIKDCGIYSSPRATVMFALTEIFESTVRRFNIVSDDQINVDVIRHLQGELLKHDFPMLELSILINCIKQVAKQNAAGNKLFVSL